jgi:hypothetical protein
VPRSCAVGISVSRDIGQVSPDRVTRVTAVATPAPFLPTTLYKEFEGVVRDMDELYVLATRLHALSTAHTGGHLLFAYRGVADASYGFFSSLYRRLWWTDQAKAVAKGNPAQSAPPPKEEELATAEGQILSDLHRWGLHDSDRGRLSILRQLALLQHHHAPTRLIDVSLNLWVSLWFAVEETRQPAGTTADTTDGRLFIIDITNRLINENNTYRAAEDRWERPWTGASPMWASLEWTTDTYAWLPSSIDKRIAAQQGAFLFGGVPTTGDQTKARLYPSDSSGHNLKIDEMRRSSSLPLRFHQAPRLDTTAAPVGRPPTSAAYTYLIPRALKPEIRSWLRSVVGLDGPGRIYPDLPGFGRFGTPWLDERPPSTPTPTGQHAPPATSPTSQSPVTPTVAT